MNNPIIYLCAFILIAFPSTTIPATDNVQDNISSVTGVSSAKVEIYKEQQMAYINAMLDCVREDRRITSEQKGLLKQMSINNMGASFAKLGGSQRSQYQYQQSGNRLQDNFDALTMKQKENDGRLKDLEIKKTDLKLKVLEATDTIPAWWGENEEYYKRTRLGLIAP